LRILVFNLGLTDLDTIKSIRTHFDKNDHDKGLTIFAECYGDVRWFLDELSSICGEPALSDFAIIKPYQGEIKNFAWRIRFTGLSLEKMGVKNMGDLVPRLETYQKTGKNISTSSLRILAQYVAISPSILQYPKALYELLEKLNEQGIKNLVRLLKQEDMRGVIEKLQDGNCIQKMHSLKDLIIQMPDTLFANLEKISELYDE
jgi:hypothetical protein